MLSERQIFATARNARLNLDVFYFAMSAVTRWTSKQTPTRLGATPAEAAVAIAERFAVDHAPSCDSDPDDATIFLAAALMSVGVEVEIVLQHCDIWGGERHPFVLAVVSGGRMLFDPVHNIFPSAPINPCHGRAQDGQLCRNDNIQLGGTCS